MVELYYFNDDSVVIFDKYSCVDTNIINNVLNTLSRFKNELDHDGINKKRCIRIKDKYIFVKSYKSLKRESLLYYIQTILKMIGFDVLLMKELQENRKIEISTHELACFMAT